MIHHKTIMKINSVEILFGDRGANTYIIHDKPLCVVDPGFTEDFGVNESRVGIVINTHAHYDHTAHNQRFKNARILAHARDAIAIQTGQHTYAEAFGANPEPVKVEEIPEKIALEKTQWQVLYTPGHTRGSISLYEPREKILICGDLLFTEGVGRTDLYGGNARQLKESIKKVAALDIDYVLPGHGSIGNKSLIEKALASL
jgi:hydroxyacylglutathione hydrolase